MKTFLISVSNTQYISTPMRLYKSCFITLPEAYTTNIPWQDTSNVFHILPLLAQIFMDFDDLIMFSMAPTASITYLEEEVLVTP